MNRQLVRLSAAAGMIIAGLLAAAYAQRSIESAQAREPSTSAEDDTKTKAAPARKRTTRSRTAPSTGSRRAASDPFSRRPAAKASDRYSQRGEPRRITEPGARARLLAEKDDATSETDEDLVAPDPSDDEAESDTAFAVELESTPGITSRDRDEEDLESESGELIDDGDSTTLAERGSALAPPSTTESSAGRPGSTQLEGLQSPSLSIEKSAPGEIQVGKPAIFTVRLRNSGGTAAHQVTVVDQVPQGTQLLATNPQATSGPGGEIIWPLGTLKPGDEAAVEMELMPLAEGEIGSLATVQFTAEVTARTRCTRPELVVQATAPGQVLIGEDVTLSIKITNSGTGAATGVVLTETLPENLEHVAGPDLEYEIGELKPGESRDLTLTMKAVKAGLVQNHITATGDGSLAAEDNSQFEVLAPGLELTMQGPKRRYLERQATYTVTVTNPGTAPATDIQLVTHLPKGLKFVEANNSGQFDPQTNSVHWTLEELPASRTGEVTLTTLPVEEGEQTLRVEGTADRGLAAEREEVVVVEGVAAILFEVLDVADPVEVGGETTYEIRVVNQGSKAALNVEILAVLPEGLDFVDAEGPTGHDTEGDQVRFRPLPRLAPKADTTFRVIARGAAPGDMRVRVQLVTDEMRKPVTKEESTQVYADE